MRVTLDARWVRSGRRDGIGRYVTELVSSFVDLGAAPRLTLLFDAPGPRDAFLEQLGAEVSPATALTPAPLLRVRDWLTLPPLLRRLGTTLYHAPNFLGAPLHHGYRTLLTVHDLIPLDPAYRAPDSSLRWRMFFGSPWLTKSCLARADHLVTVSEATRAEVEKLIGSSPPITVIPNGVTLPEPSAAAEAALPELPERFLLYVGRLDPHKAVGAWLEEYATLETALRTHLPIVLAGEPDPRAHEALEARARSLGLDRSVHWVGSVDDATLDLLYRRATLLVHPAQREGFGLTVLEAMARGTPVVARAIAPMREVAGDGACLVPPEDRGALARAVARLVGDPEELRRLGERGRERAAALTWRRAAERTLALYDELASRPGDGP